MDVQKFRNGSLHFWIADVDQEDEDVLLYAFRSYSHVLPVGQFTLAEFSAEIKKHYSMENPVNKAVCEVLERI